MSKTQKAIEFWELKHEIDDEIARLGWSKDECIAYIQKHYQKRSRLAMNDYQLKHLLSQLQLKGRDETSAKPSQRIRKSRRDRRK